MKNLKIQIKSTWNIDNLYSMISFITWVICHYKSTPKEYESLFMITTFLLSISAIIKHLPLVKTNQHFPWYEVLFAFCFIILAAIFYGLEITQFLLILTCLIVGLVIFSFFLHKYIADSVFNRKEFNIVLLIICVIILFIMTIIRLKF